jgi:hypothetical protein
MINLRGVYGNKIFDRKAAYANARYIPFVSSCLLDIVIALAIIGIFNVHWDYAFLKVYGLLLLCGVLKYIFSALIDVINYRLIIRNSLTFEMKHYLNLFNISVNWDEVATYDDFLLEAAFNKALPDDLRVLSAINYGTIIDLMTLDPHFENRSYNLFCKIVPDFLPKDEKIKEFTSA